MSDRRFCRAAGVVAHESLRDTLEGVEFVAGDWRRISGSVADLCAAPNGARDRQLLFGARFCVLTEADGWAYGFDEDDGYCGWVAAEACGEDAAVTHWVASPGTHLYPAPDIKTAEVLALHLGARVLVAGSQPPFVQTPHGFIPASHLRPLDERLTDPVAVARGFLGTPYVWGGNSRAGIDCSGLVQIARRACGLHCPADSDLQCAMAGQDVAEPDLQPGDLVFWPGHVAMVSEPGHIIHANAHHMAVVEERYDAAVARIAASGDPVLRRLRA